MSMSNFMNDKKNRKNQESNVKESSVFSIPVNYELNESDSDMNRFFGDDEETRALLRAKGEESLQEIKSHDNDPIADLIQESFDEYRKKYGPGTFKASHFLTTDIMRMAPEDYFDQFEEDVKKAVDWTQTTIADKDLSEVIAQSKVNPTDEKLQEDAFKIVQSITIEYLDKIAYRGIRREIMKVLIANEIVGFSRIDPLWRDTSVTEIICNGPKDIQVEIKGILYRVPSCKFRDAEHLEILLERIFGAVNKKLSRSTPIIKGRLHDNSRIHAVGRIAAPMGPNVNIRRHPEKFWGPQDFIDLGSASEEMMEYLGNLIYKGCSYLVVGGMSTGKTSLLNGLTGFIRNDDRIVTLEDSIEMKPNPNKMIAAAMECVAPSIDRAGDKGVTMRHLVKATTQMAPKCIIVGEVTDSAAMDLIQVLNTGHYGASTVHANTAFDGIYRMASLIAQSEEATMEGALPLIAAAFDFIVHVKHYSVDGSRRIESISEVAPFPKVDESGAAILPLNPLWKFKNEGLVDGKVKGHWEKVGEISKIRAERRNLGIERDLTWEELKELSKI